MSTDTRVWQEEIFAELADAQSKLKAVVSEHAVACEVARAAERALRAKRAELAPIADPAWPIVLRLRQLEAARNAANGNKTRTGLLLDEARREVQKYEMALAQLDQVIKPAEVAA